MYIFLDESGGVGFSDGSSKYLVIALVVTRDRKELEYPIKRVRGRILKKKLRELPEIKASDSSPRIKKKVLEGLAKRNIEIHSIICNKSKVRSHLRRNKRALYNYICRLIVEPTVLDMGGEINLIVDKRTKRRSIRRGFDIYLLEMIKKKQFFMADDHKVNIKITHKESCNDRALQATDFIANAIFRKFEHQDTQYYDVIKEKITTEKRLFF